MKDQTSPEARSPHRAITFYGYAVKKDGKYLGAASATATAEVKITRAETARE